MKTCAVLVLVLASGCTGLGSKDLETLEVFEDANAAFDNGDFETASALYRDVIKSRPRIVEAYVKLWQCENGLGDHMAYEWLERGRVACGLNPVVAIPLARVYASLGRRKEAREIFAALLPTHPELKEEMESLGSR